MTKRYMFVASPSAFNAIRQSLREMVTQPCSGTMADVFEDSVRALQALDAAFGGVSSRTTRTSFETDDDVVAWEVANQFYCEDRYVTVFVDGTQVTTDIEMLVTYPNLLEGGVSI